MKTGGLASPPKLSGVSLCATERIGTRISGRLPSIYTLVDFGKGWTAASSTWAVAASNFSGAFMWLLCVRSQQRSVRPWGGCACTHAVSRASLRWHYPDQVQRVFLTHATSARRTPSVCRLAAAGG